MIALEFESYAAQFNSDNTAENSSISIAELDDSVSLEKNPSTIARSLLVIGVSFWRSGSLERAEELITKAQEISASLQDGPLLAQCCTGLALVKTRLAKIDEAIDSYSQAIKLEPQNFHLWNNLGNLYLRHNRIEDALSAFMQSIFLNSENIAAWNGLANVQYQNGNMDDAIYSYKRTIELTPAIDLEQTNTLSTDVSQSYVLPWLRLAELYLQKQQYQKAIDAYRIVVDHDPKNAVAWNELGEAYFQCGTYNEAEVALLNAIEIDSSIQGTFLKLAKVYTRLGKHQESIPFYLKSIEQLPDQHEKNIASKLLEKAISAANQNRSSTLAVNVVAEENKPITSTQGRENWFYSKYSEEFSAVNLSWPIQVRNNIVIRPVDTNKKTKYAKRIPYKNMRKAKNRGKNMSNFFFKRRSKRSNTLRASRTVTVEPSRNSSTNPAVWNEKGNIHFKDENYEEAMASYRKAIELDPKFGHAYHNLAIIFLMKGDCSQAIQKYQKSLGCLTLDREKAVAWNGIGNVYRCIRDYENARLAYQIAAELDNKTGGVYDSIIIFGLSEKNKTAGFWNELGKLFFQTGMYEKAAFAFHESIRKDPSSGQAYGYLARTLAARGQYKDSIFYYQKSIDFTRDDKEKANAWNRLGDVYRKLNDYNNALNAYQNAMLLGKDSLSLLNRTRLSLLSNCATK